MRYQVAVFLLGMMFLVPSARAENLQAGTAKVDITSPDATKVHDPCFAKVLVLRQGENSVVLVTLDAVAIGTIGYVPNDFLPSLRSRLNEELQVPAGNVLVNASHCHGHVQRDLVPAVMQAVHEAWKKIEPVRIGSGSTTESRISENRRVILKDGRQVDMRRAYAFAWDEEIDSTGPIDSQVGLLRLDRLDGRPLALVYNFACHPIMNPPARGSSADFPGAASHLLETAFDGEAMAFFIQGCAGDINPVRYKEVHVFPDATPLGYFLGVSVLDAIQAIPTDDPQELICSRQVLELPRATDYADRIAALESEREKLVSSLRGTNVNFKTFLALMLQERLHPDYPSLSKQGYLHDETIQREDHTLFDAESKAQVDAYLANIRIMERITRLNTNLALLKKHQRETTEAGSSTLEVEVCGLRIGDFKLVTFPGELTVQVGQNIKAAVKDPTAFVAGYTNGYIYYTPTVAQRANTGYAQEDCDCLVAPSWQLQFETAAVEVLQKLNSAGQETP